MGQRHDGRGRGFTFIDLMVVILIVCLLSGMVFSAGGLMRTRETANRIKCAANLKQIGLAIQLYSNENKGMYPRTLYKPDADVTQYTGLDCKDPFGAAPIPKVNDITAAMFLLVRTQDIGSDVFICPSTDATPMKYGEGKTAQDFGNFKSEENLTYSMANLYPSMDTIKTGYKMNATTGAEIAIVADMNPGTVGEYDASAKNGPKNEKEAAATLRKGNSMNHRGQGQNVLYGDGHVEFQQTPFCGQKMDNIYTVSGSDDGSKTTSETISGTPKWAGDSVLLPAATATPHKKTPEQEEAAAIQYFKTLLPKIKEQIAAEERKNGETPRVKQAKAQIEAIEKEMAESEARLKAGGKTDPDGAPEKKQTGAAPDLFNLRAEVTSAKNVVTGIKLAMEVFEVDNGRFPTTAEGLSALVKAPAGLTNWHGPYVEEKQIKADPWNHPYVYKCPGTRNPGGFDISSLGPDGVESSDDIHE